jgi:hypothetical protein
MKEYNWVSLGCGVIANQLTWDVMEIMTRLRREWGLCCPEELGKEGQP